MSGGDALKGFLVQTLIALLEALKDDPPWTSVRLEPELDSEKIDILWVYKNGTTKAVQVKSSQNPFSPTQVKQWAGDLQESRAADRYELCLVGPTTPTVAKIGRVGNVDVPTPKNLDLPAFKSDAAHRLNGLLPKLGLPARTAEQLDDLVSLLLENLASGSVDGQTLSRDGLTELLCGWIAHSGTGVRIVRVFVACPKDAEEERAALEQIVKSINTTEGDAHQVRLELRPAESLLAQGEAAEGLQDATRRPAEGELFLGIVSTAFDEQASEDLFRRASNRWQTLGSPWIKFYFDDQPRVPRNKRAAYDTVCGLRDQLEPLRVVCGYTDVRGGEDSFHSKVFEHLRATLLMLKHPSPATAAMSPVTNRLPERVAHYLMRLAERTGTLTLLGMGRSLQVELPIDEAYVPLQTTLARSLEQRPTDRYCDGHAEHEQRVDLGRVFSKASQLGLRGVVLLGEPGSGKTTGARQITWRLASGQSSPEDLGLPAGAVPVFLRFRNLRREMLAEKQGLRAFLESETCCDEAPDGLETPGPDLWNGRGGPLLWILDGLDEVVDPKMRKRVAGWVRKALANRPEDRFLVTCRFQGYFREGVPLGPKFVEFHVRPLDDKQVQRFVRDWFGAAYGKLLGPGRRAKARAQADSRELLDILARPAYQAGHIRELCTNPLLLTILCIVFHEERKLPTGRAELYAHCVRVLLEYWRRDLYAAELGTGLQAYDAEAAQAVLARVAWWMHQQQDRTAAPLAELAAEAAKGLADVSPSSGLGGDGLGFLQRMRDEAGVLAMSGEGAGRCGFLHLSFQEYLAAEHAAREGLAKELAARAVESWWREVALLSLRRSRPYCEAFFAAMLEAGIPEQHPDLAQRCLEEALYFAGAPFVAVLNRPRPRGADAGRGHDARVAAVLRLLRDRAKQVPELEGICRQLADSSDQQTRGFAREILAHLGIAVPAEPAEYGVIVDDRTEVTFVVLPPGEFQMGSIKETSNEQPVQPVRITRGFLLGKYPVTNAQYARFLAAAGKSVRKPASWDDRRFNQSEQPVVGVSWEEAVAYCEWAGGRLPTEAEWEYACRSGTTWEYCFGDDAAMLDQYAWFAENSGGQTQPVGAKKPNAWGLHDMHGNVWEWCADWFSSTYYRTSPKVDPTGPDGGSYRVRRGGSWANGAGGCRAAFRDGGDPSHRDVGLGFRLARTVPS